MSISEAATGLALVYLGGVLIVILLLITIGIDALVVRFREWRRRRSRRLR